MLSAMAPILSQVDSYFIVELCLYTECNIGLVVFVDVTLEQSSVVSSNIKTFERLNFLITLVGYAHSIGLFVGTGKNLDNMTHNAITQAYTMLCKNVTLMQNSATMRFILATQFSSAASSSDPYKIVATNPPWQLSRQGP